MRITYRGRSHSQEPVSDASDVKLTCCHRPEVFPRDRVQLLCHGTVDAGLCSFPRGFKEHGEDGEEYRHEGWVSGEVRVHRPRVDRVHRHIGICEENRPASVSPLFNLQSIINELNLSSGWRDCHDTSSCTTWNTNITPKSVFVITNPLFVTTLLLLQVICPFSHTCVHVCLFVCVPLSLRANSLVNSTLASLLWQYASPLL